MLVNADFSRSVIVAPDHYQWLASPQSGVERVMLDRLGGEKARATSIVRYAPGSSFPCHVHPGGEEILVLSGTFSDEAHYPAGWYLRNPPGSCHQPFSDAGAVIFVKLWQMSQEDERRVRIDTCDPASWQDRDGRATCVLHSSDDEQVGLHRLAPDERVFAGPADSAELLVLAGDVVAAGRSYERGSWMRLPAGEYPELAAGIRGATVYLKTGHLSRVAMGA